MSEGWYQIGDIIHPFIYSFIHTFHVRSLDSCGEDKYVMSAQQVGYKREKTEGYGNTEKYINETGEKAHVLKK